MNPANRVQRHIAVVIIAALAFSGCGRDRKSTSGKDSILIGISLPLTGDFSEPGKGIQRGYETWAKVVNDGGGLLGRPVKLKFLDDQSSADRVVSDYEQLIGKDKVDLVFGPFSTRLVVPSARVAEEYGMLFVEPAGAAKQVFEQGFKNLFYAAPAGSTNSIPYSSATRAAGTTSRVENGPNTRSTLSLPISCS